ncbi:hypothetical protein ACFWVP_16065 [Streptomyces sp. NPDC058637]
MDLQQLDTTIPDRAVIDLIGAAGAGAASVRLGFTWALSDK